MVSHEAPLSHLGDELTVDNAAILDQLGNSLIISREASWHGLVHPTDPSSIPRHLRHRRARGLGASPVPLDRRHDSGDARALARSTVTPSAVGAVARHQRGHALRRTIRIGLHRLLIHRSFSAPLWVERALVYLGTLVGMAWPLGMVAATRHARLGARDRPLPSDRELVRARSPAIAASAPRRRSASPTMRIAGPSRPEASTRSARSRGRAVDDLLVRTGGVEDEERRSSSGASPSAMARSSSTPQGLLGHVDHGGDARVGERAPVQVLGQGPAAVVAGDVLQAARRVAVGERDAERGRRALRRRDARHHARRGCRRAGRRRSPRRPGRRPAGRRISGAPPACRIWRARPSAR